MEDRVLVIANAALSLSDSNGRTMAMILSKYKPEQLAQFYTYGKQDPSICHSYYRVSDSEAFRSFLKRQEIGGQTAPNEEKQQILNTSKNKLKRTPLTMLLREFVWKHGKWCGAKVWRWVDEFNPTVIFINVADNIFLIDFAICVAKRYQIPVVVFSTEEFPFKKYNYLTKRFSIFYWLFNAKLNMAYRGIAKFVKNGYFNSPMLRNEYAKRYSYPCYVAMNKSQIEWIENAEIPDIVRISYLGNLGLNRHLPLIEIADVIAEILPGTKLDIYGRIPNSAVEMAFDNCKNINYIGFVSYEEVTRIIHESTLVIHAETQEAFYIRDLRYGFSTKIADSVCSGTPLLIYGDVSMAVMDFIKKEDCAFICANRSQLKTVVKAALTDVEARKRVLKNAKAAKEKYFNGRAIDLMENSQ